MMKRSDKYPHLSVDDDDIIIPPALTPDIVEWLESLSELQIFTPNDTLEEIMFQSGAAKLAEVVSEYYSHQQSDSQ